MVNSARDLLKAHLDCHLKLSEESDFYDTIDTINFDSDRQKVARVETCIEIREAIGYNLIEERDYFFRHYCYFEPSISKSRSTMVLMTFDCVMEFSEQLNHDIESYFKIFKGDTPMPEKYKAEPVFLARAFGLQEIFDIIPKYLGNNSLFIEPAVVGYNGIKKMSVPVVLDNVAEALSKLYLMVLKEKSFKQNG